ncbi:hypothetical protein ABID16_004656 [Rhizobium aquaticum]|uniref:Phage tail collar domain-containing protein n=1 Tax=Rhizobium aquaticum TaxID=1549636 RepID=A0ABV2J6A7_9HYPH
MNYRLLALLLIVPAAAFAASPAADGSDNTITGPAKVTGPLFGESVHGGWIATTGDAVAGARDDRIMTPKATRAALDVAIPTGTVFMFAGAVPPQGWLALNGQTVSAKEHPELVQRLGNGSASVTLPVMAAPKGFIAAVKG